MKPDFQSVDADRDGRISQGELSKAKGGELSKLDANRDRVLDRNEYGSITQVPGASAGPGFDKLDRNSDGQVSRQEAAALLESADFAKADLNRNGQLERSEYNSLPARQPAPPAALDPETTRAPMLRDD